MLRNQSGLNNSIAAALRRREPQDCVSSSGSVFSHSRFTAAAPLQLSALANQWPHYYLNRSKSRIPGGGSPRAGSEIRRSGQKRRDGFLKEQGGINEWVMLVETTPGGGEAQKRLLSAASEDGTANKDSGPQSGRFSVTSGFGDPNAERVLVFFTHHCASTLPRKTTFSYRRFRVHRTSLPSGATESRKTRSARKSSTMQSEHTGPASQPGTQRKESPRHPPANRRDPASWSESLPLCIRPAGATASPSTYHPPRFPQTSEPSYDGATFIL